MKISAIYLIFLLSNLHAISIDSLNGGISSIKVYSKNMPIVEFNNKKAVVLNKGSYYEAYIGVPLKAKDSINVLVDGDKKEIKINYIEYKKQYITLKNKSKVNPNKEQLNRYYKEKKEIEQYLSSYSNKEPDTNFITPVKGRVSGTFGVRRFYNNEERSPHKGLDIAAKKGVKIKSASSGEVVGIGDYFFNGKTVFVEHGMGLISMYCHMSKIDVKVGQQVKKGEYIGEVGSSGRATGPHLHFGVMLNGEWVNPKNFTTL